MTLDAFHTGVPLGYCTNVHAGAGYAAMRANLQRYAPAVKRIVSPDAPMGVGLWLSAEAARELIAAQGIGELRDWLGEQGLVPFTFNGFPHGDFHQPIVKHRVYEPDWADPARLRYTRDLITILAQLLPEGAEGSISTLPIGWRAAFATEERDRAAAEQLLDLVHHLARSELDTGRLIHIDLEPEPGCRLDVADDVVAFFERYLLRNLDAESVRAYLRVCHDVCHAAVMFEPQADVLARYERAGIGVGKVQVSSAVAADFTPMNPAQRRDALAQLAAFREERYLHQTVVQHADGRTTFYEDLPQAIAAAGGADAGPPDGRWRVHFHVPIHIDAFGALHTTQDQIAPAVRRAVASGCRHIEVETYAWGVLPEPLRVDDLATGIARELDWLRGVGQGEVKDAPAVPGR